MIFLLFSSTRNKLPVNPASQSDSLIYSIVDWLIPLVPLVYTREWGNWVEENWT